LVARCLSGDREALRRFFETHLWLLEEFIEAKGLGVWGEEILESTMDEFLALPRRHKNWTAADLRKRILSSIRDRAFTSIYWAMKNRVERIIGAMNAMEWRVSVFSETFTAVWLRLLDGRVVQSTKKPNMPALVEQVCRNKVRDQIRRRKQERKTGTVVVPAGDKIERFVEKNGDVFNPAPDPFCPVPEGCPEDDDPNEGDNGFCDEPLTGTLEHRLWLLEHGELRGENGIAHGLLMFILNRMGPAQKRALVGYYDLERREGLSGVEASRRLGMTKGNYRSAKWRAKRALERELDRLGGATCND
jgi:DNA-directed RNA polymerase specialized sigma24 family protein